MPNNPRDENHPSRLPSASCSKTVQGECAPGSWRAHILRSNRGFRRERHLEGESWLRDVEYGGELDPATVPNGAADTATFAFSNIRNVFFAADTEVNGIVFNAGASPFTFINQAPTVTISGKGITNNSGIVQNFTPGPGQITFTNSATAGSSTSFTNTGAIVFAGSSSAGNATFSNDV